MKLTKENIKVGLTVKLNPDSQYSNQSKSVGYILSLPNSENWLKVRWEKALTGPKINTYELHDLILVDSIKKIWI